MINYEKMSQDFETLFREQAEYAATFRKITLEACGFTTDGDLISKLNDAKVDLEYTDRRLAELKAKYIAQIQNLKFFQPL